MVKIVNASRKKFKEMEELIVHESKKEVRAERKAVKLQAKQQAELKAKLEKEKAEKEAEERRNNPTEQELLKQIRDLLASQSAKTKKQKADK